MICAENRSYLEITFSGSWKRQISQSTAERSPWKVRRHGGLPPLTFTNDCENARQGAP